MASRGGLGASLNRAFLIQAALIALVAVVGVYLAAFTLERVLIKQALEEEAEHYWSIRSNNPSLQLPNTKNLTGYMAAPGAHDPVPDELRGLSEGFHSMPDADGFSAAHVSTQGRETLYLVFDGERVNELAIYFGIAPLAGVLVVLYLAAWITYRLTRRAISPVVQLAHSVRELDLEAPDPSVFAPERLPPKAGEEVHDLAQSLRRLIERVNAFVVRERHFTRDASHELRSPLTVIGMAADMLLTEQELDRPVRNSVLRIKRASADMHELTETLLLLARESDQGLLAGEIDLHTVVLAEIERSHMLVHDQNIEIVTAFDNDLRLRAPEKVVAMLVGNLIRNAFAYTDEGRVVIAIVGHELRISDTGIGISDAAIGDVFKPFVRGVGASRRGHGVGLSIVKRLSDRFGWQVRLASKVGEGTNVTVGFPDGVVFAVGSRVQPA